MSHTPTFTVYDDATAGALGKDPTVAYTGSDSLAAATRQWRCEDWNTLTLHFVLVAGTAPTSVEFLLEASNSDAQTAADVSTWAVMPVAVEGAGSIVTQETIRQIVWAVTASSDTSHTWMEPVSAHKFRVRVKRTGGDATTRIRVDAVLAVR